MNAKVWLVGAGPGDPELLTLKALRALQDADVILHDRLVPAAVLDLARRDAARICVGKAAGNIGSTGLFGSADLYGISPIASAAKARSRSLCDFNRSDNPGPTG